MTHNCSITLAQPLNPSSRDKYDVNKQIMAVSKAVAMVVTMH